LIAALRPLEPMRNQRNKADPLGWLIATARLDRFPDDILLRLAREYYPHWSRRRDRPRPIELRSLCEHLLRQTLGTSRPRMTED
jgi:hypothetical protein